MPTKQTLNRGSRSRFSLRSKTRESLRSSRASGYVGGNYGVLFTPPNLQLQILHGEQETSLRAAGEDLIAINSKLEKQQQLNEKLENDLLDFEKHQQAQVNGKHEAREALKGTASSDALAGIELGKKQSVCVSLSKPVPWDNSEYQPPVVTSANHSNTIYIKLRGCIYPAHRDQPTRQV